MFLFRRGVSFGTRVEVLAKFAIFMQLMEKYHSSGTTSTSLSG
jgi:hypothetical protein